MSLPPLPAVGATTKAENYDKITAWANAVGALALNALPIKGSLGTEDLNTILTPGIYFQSNGANATPERNYPANGLAIAVAVLPSAAATGFVTQEAMVSAGGYVAKGKFVRSVVSGGVFSPWQFAPTRRIGEIVGRALYTWDHLKNREQLEATSDTGWWRVIEPGAIADLPNMAGFITRRGYEVTFSIGETAVNATPLTAGTRTIYTLPAGFKFSSIGPIPTYATGAIINPGTGALLQAALKVPSVASGVVQLDVLAGMRHAGSVSWRTLDPWPTIAPGTQIAPPPFA